MPREQSLKLLAVALIGGGKLRPFGSGVATVYVKERTVMFSLALRLWKKTVGLRSAEGLRSVLLHNVTVCLEDLDVPLH